MGIRMDHTHTIKRFVIDEFIPDISPDELSSDEDLLTSGIIDSLGLLKVIAWLEHQFHLAVDDVELSPDSFRSVAAINSFIANTRPVGAN
jgi:acyl carrier protein